MSALDPQTIAQLAAALPSAEFGSILRTFVADLSRLACEYRDAADADTARRTAHALAGTAAGIGALRLEAVARRAMAQDAAAADYVADLTREAEAAVREIAATADRLAGQPT